MTKGIVKIEDSFRRALLRRSPTTIEAQPHLEGTLKRIRRTRREDWEQWRSLAALLHDSEELQDQVNLDAGELESPLKLEDQFELNGFGGVLDVASELSRVEALVCGEDPVPPVLYRDSDNRFEKHLHRAIYFSQVMQRMIRNFKPSVVDLVESQGVSIKAVLRALELCQWKAEEIASSITDRPEIKAETA